MPLSIDDYDGIFDRADESEYAPLARRLLSYDSPIRKERRENEKTSLRIFSAFDEVDWFLAATFKDHERHDIERS